jgi:hypothetical protein
MKVSNIATLLYFTAIVISQKICPPDTPLSIAVRAVWEHRWVRCENMKEGDCPKNLQGPYPNPSDDDCQNYYTESGDDYILRYFLCEKQSKFDDLKPTLEKNGWLCTISE